MNSLHDMGGTHGYGPVVLENPEPLFHHEWERRAFAVTLAMGASGQWNIDMNRRARESLPPLLYLTSSYYKIWFEGLLNLCVEKELVTQEEIAAGKMLFPAKPDFRTLMSENVVEKFMSGWPSHREVKQEAAFSVGDRIHTKPINSEHHNRMPRYCRDKVGTVVYVHGAHVFPDSHAHGRGEDPQWMYTVRFDAKELWGEDTTASAINVDLWEPYLKLEV